MILVCKCGHSAGSHSNEVGCLHLVNHQNSNVICPCNDKEIFSDYLKRFRSNWKNKKKLSEEKYRV